MMQSADGELRSAWGSEMAYLKNACGTEGSA